ncbi:dethiobiotin synthase [Aeromonas bivalvium]|uniref:dethiobiotin synthase n=1 Tax=Aeromonas bivalvium TaxID=440079 RepID=UPI0038CFD288
MATFFITGTDTDVGKTLVTRALLQGLSAEGLACAGYKPVSAGCEPTPEGLRNRDALLLQQAASVALPYEWVNPFAYAPPIAPHIAATQAGQPIDEAGITAGLRRIEGSSADWVLVEGAGGWHLPLNEHRLLSDWVAQQRLPVVLVVGAKLGCLNHALLTLAAIEQAGLSLAGWVMNRLPCGMSCYEENLATLRQRLPAPLLGEIPTLSDPDSANLREYINISLLRRARYSGSIHR